MRDSRGTIHQIVELDRLNGGGVFETFATTFLEAMPITLADLWTAVREEDAVGVARAAHAVKGATRNLGAQLMAELSQELEALG
jgi:HPt (histidine-containing phosphotransfer) domain-containing protein